ncbi:hypothetical protein LINPERHAP1_LOCUS22174 [Linum perenne]
MTPTGISWLATQYSKPINKHVRSGLAVNLCVLKRGDSREEGILRVDIGKEEPVEVVVSFLAERSYGRVPLKGE